MTDAGFSASPLLGRAWRAALATFVLAGATGVLFRFAVAYGWPLGLLPVNVRHAHSHLMFFGWATPALMIGLLYRVEQATRRQVRGAAAVLAVMFAAALLAFVPFLLYGYAPARIGTASLPLSVMAAGLNVVGWYAFAALYVRERRRGFDGPVARRADVAIGLLVLATLGAWGLPALQVLGTATPPLMQALTALFLSTMSEGWFVLGVLALAYAGVEAPRWPFHTAAAGIPFTFALTLHAAHVPPLWLALGRAGTLLVGVGLLGCVAQLWRLRPAWRLPLALLALKAAGQVGAALWPGFSWASMAGFHILYLHLMLLGFVTLGLVRDGLGARARRAFRLMAAAVLGLLLSLLPLTPAWPLPFPGAWSYALAAWAALLPVGAALVALWTTRRAGARAEHPASTPA